MPVASHLAAASDAAPGEAAQGGPVAANFGIGDDTLVATIVAVIEGAVVPLVKGGVALGLLEVRVILVRLRSEQGKVLGGICALDC